MAWLTPVGPGMQKQKHASQRASQPGEAATTAIPDKLYFRIGEVAKLCKVQAYVLRFWESEFPQLKPNKGGTGQRLYRKRDVEIALQVKHLLHEEGYTIAGARQVLQGDSRDGRKKDQPGLTLNAAMRGRSQDKNQAKLQRLRMELKDMLEMLSTKRPAGRKERHAKKETASMPNLFGE